MGPRTKVHEILGMGISFDWPDPNTAKFCCALTKSVQDIRCAWCIIITGTPRLLWNNFRINQYKLAMFIHKY